MRVAIYFAPATESGLWRDGCHWLGRDPASGVSPAQPAVAGLTAERFAALTGSARRYGFHATLKPPFSLRPGQDLAALRTAIEAFAARHTAVDGLGLAPRMIGDFLALVPVGDETAINALAAAAVEAFESFRLPESAERIAKRAMGLNARQAALLGQYGYPYVMDEFRFHMTLTDRLPEALAPDMAAAAGRHFAAALSVPLALDRLSLFIEDEPGADFRREADYPLG